MKGRFPMKKDIIIAIETSCDETAVAVMSDDCELLSNIVASQIDIHQLYGGVVPEIASRHHLEQIDQLIDQALTAANLSLKDITAVAVTYGPGLVGALLVGVSAAKGLAYGLDVPLIGVNHIEGHIYANWITRRKWDFPLLCLIVSGGHTALVLMKGHGRYELLGQTRDDAVGEAFDKIARVMGLGYPGGPLLDKLAQKGDPCSISLPRAWLSKDSFDFSFSGLKTAVINYLHRARQKSEEVDKADLAASFQQSVVDVLIEKTMRALSKYNLKTLLVAGGVAGNSALRERLKICCAEQGIDLHIPELGHCTDNAAMIACAGMYRFKNGERSAWDLNAVPNLKLTEVASENRQNQV